MFIPFCLPGNVRIITIFGLGRIIVNGPMGREKDFFPKPIFILPLHRIFLLFVDLCIEALTFLMNNKHTMILLMFPNR